MKYYILNSEGFYLGLQLDNPDGYEFYTTIPPIGNFIKFKFDGEKWTEGATVEEILNAREVPEQVPLWCVKVILHELNLIEQVQNALSQLPEPNKTRANYIWEYGNIIQRQSPTVAFIGQVLGLSEKQMDELFINADSINL